MIDGIKELAKKPLRRWRRRRLIALGGAPADWYDAAYDGSVEEYTAHYSQSRYLPPWEAIAERMEPGRNILEVGCGPGQLAQLLLDRDVFASYVGFDFSAAAIELARKNLPESVRLEVADARTTELLDEPGYDSIICTEVLEHIMEDLLVLERVRSGVQVLATVPDFDYLSHVRFFADANEVRARYGHLFHDLEISEHHHANDTEGKRGTFFLINGIKK